MADRNTKPRNTSPPSPIVKFLPVVIIVIGAAIAAYFFIPRGGNAPAPSAVPAAGTPGTAAQPTAAAPAVPAPELTKEQLIKEASSAMREQRYVAPQGNNALEYYLRVLGKEPNNATATDALREMFPIVIGPVEQDINAGNLDEATRVIDLLAKFDPNNYSLTILRGKLDAKKKQVDNEQKQQAAAAAAAAAKAAAAAAPGAATPAAAAPDTTAAATPAGTTTPGSTAARPATTPAAATAAATPAPAPVAATPPPAPSGESHGAELVKSSAPEYPREAFIKHQEGWVEVEFTVTAEGAVTNATVVGAQPSRVFNDAALRAVQRWTFKPKMDNGKAVDDRMRRRIEFKLGAG